MKRETNNDIDLLLRRMSRRDGSSVRDGEAQDQHLDVDELSSYAQNALPTAARARYTEHLTECSTCRRLVTELSLSLGTTVAAAAPVETVAEASGLKKFLASLFSPMVLRYAVPALGLIVVAVVGFVILRQPNREGFVAQLDQNGKQSAPVATTAEAPASAESPAAGLIDRQKENEKENRVAQPKTARPESGADAGDAAGAGSAPVASAPARDENAAPPPKPQSSPYVADGVQSGAKVAAPAETEEQKKKDADAKKTPQPAVTVQSADAVSKKQANEPVREYSSEKETEGARVDHKKREALPVQGRTASVGALARARADQEKAGDTRTVAGRRFRKERGIWTDTAYDSSTKTINMARGSEQFRGLVADEPQIKQIAEQLDGEVIVVWKGRAYRIR